MKAVCVFLVVALSLVGCSTLEGLGKDLQRGGEMIENAAK